MMLKYFQFRLHRSPVILVLIVAVISLCRGGVECVAAKQDGNVANVDQATTDAVNLLIEQQKKVFEGIAIDSQATQVARNALFELKQKAKHGDRESIAHYLVVMRVLSLVFCHV